jgi:hypothetical protein
LPQGGGDHEAETFVLVVNAGSVPAAVMVVPWIEPGPPTGPLPPATATPITVPPGERVTVAMSPFVRARRFSTMVIESGTATGALVVEGAIYWNAGASLPATRVP